jgi:hypothetical protein
MTIIIRHVAEWQNNNLAKQDAKDNSMNLLAVLLALMFSRP